MGGPHVAYTDDINSLFINPGAFKTIKQVSIAELSAGAYGDVFGLMDIVKNMDDSSKLASTFSKFIRESDGNIPLGFDIRGPIAFGNIKNGWGWGVFNRIYGGALVKGSTIQAWANGDVMLNLGYGFRVLEWGTHTLDAGVLGKVFGRIGFDTQRLSLPDLNSGTDAFMTRLNYAPFTIGGGLDVGLQYRLVDNFTAALTVNDLFSLGYVSYNYIDLNLKSAAPSAPPGYLGYIKPNINLGLSYKLYDNSLVSWAVMADYKDLINLFRQNKYDSRNGLLNVSVGTEVTLFNKLLSFRLGMNEMLPAVGVGLDLFICKLNAAFYGKELGNEPGNMSTYAMDVGLLFRY
jgi:hypothetical protein